jgi:predicted nuclease of restriction endonuclease-like (RecB) superfamily
VKNFTLKAFLFLTLCVTLLDLAWVSYSLVEAEKLQQEKETFYSDCLVKHRMPECVLLGQIQFPEQGE